MGTPRAGRTQRPQEEEARRRPPGRRHGTLPHRGAIANEAGLDSKFIGAIEILDDHTIVALPEMPREIMELLQETWVSGQRLRIRPEEGAPEGDGWFTRGKKKEGKPFQKKEGKTFHKKGDKKSTPFAGPKKDKGKGKVKKKHRKGGE